MTGNDMSATAIEGRATRVGRGFLLANKWLLLRRGSQLGILALFLLGPLAGIWIVKGNLSASETLSVLPLADPFVVLQSLAAGEIPYRTVLVGAALVLALYLAVGGRAYCAWVCPVNMITDAAAWLRRAFGLTNPRAPPAATRYWLLAGALGAAAATGTLAWEFVNPVSMTHRALIFGGGLAWGIAIAVFLFDLLLAQRGFCGRICPQGAFYAIVGKASLLRVSAHRRRACNDCADCYAVCPEPAVIPPALKPQDAAASPIITAGACTNCGRCIDVCAEDVFRFTIRFDRRSEA
jgi:ferredoxin-type protein NapH